MNFTNVPQEELSSYFTKINTYLESNFEIQWTKYLDLGVKKVRLISYSKEFLPHIERHMSYVLCDNLDSYDATLILWQEKDVENLANYLADKFNPKKNLKLRVELLANRRTFVDSIIISKDSRLDGEAEIRILLEHGICEAKDTTTNTYYYSLKSLEPEDDVAKTGHMFVYPITHILRGENTGLVHSAVVGLNNKGILFCGRSGKGKSTLSVTSMMAGFEYVSDDYLTIEREGNKIYTYPIYSMISLSHKMYDILYDRMKGKFMSNNCPKTKYIFNIAAYHDQFRKKYPIELCLFPQITDDKEPSILPCAKSLPMMQFVHSSLEQVRLLNDKQSLKNYYDMIKDLNYYQINLSKDLDKNVACLRSFLESYNPKEKHVFEEQEIIFDTFINKGYLFDVSNLTFYSMNRITTNIYKNLMNDVSTKAIIDKINSFDYIPEKEKIIIEQKIIKFVEVLQEKSLLRNYKNNSANVIIDEELLVQERGHVHLIEHAEDGNIFLLKD